MKKISGWSFFDLWRLDGVVDRGPYAAIGLLGFVVKYNLDRLIASAIFHQPWDLFKYIIPQKPLFLISGDWHDPSENEIFLFGTILVVALPFIWIGVALTLRRLRAIGLPTWLVTLFFFPVINLIFFLLLAILPSRPTEDSQFFERKEKGVLNWIIPDHPLGSAWVALVFTLLFGLIAAILSTKIFASYGWGLFVALPFCLGLVSVLLYSHRSPRSFRSCLLVAVLSIALLGVGFLGLAVEGVICLLMAAPIALVLAIMGGSVGYFIQRCSWNRDQTLKVCLLLMLSVPLLMGAELVSVPREPLFSVCTSVEINAPPERVWQSVVTFSELPEPTELLFRLGIAYPVKATIQGTGVGAVRHCEFSTGPFVEPIEVWDEPRLLKFSVTQNPAPMQEWTPYRAINPPHLHGFLVSEGGQFLLKPLPNGKTQLEGTTWYRHHMWPAGYWQIWSDQIIHQIHLRVLKHIQYLAENG